MIIKTLEDFKAFTGLDKKQEAAEKEFADYLLKDYREELKQRYSKLAARVFKAVNYGR